MPQKVKSLAARLIAAPTDVLMCSQCTDVRMCSRCNHPALGPRTRPGLCKGEFPNAKNRQKAASQCVCVFVRKKHGGAIDLFCGAIELL